MKIPKIKLPPKYRVNKFDGYYEIQERFALFFYITLRTPENDMIFQRFPDFEAVRSFLYFNSYEDYLAIDPY